MCIRDRNNQIDFSLFDKVNANSVIRGKENYLFEINYLRACLLYTSDAADERSSVDLGGRRIIKKKQTR